MDNLNNLAEWFYWSGVILLVVTVAAIALEILFPPKDDEE